MDKRIVMDFYLAFAYDADSQTKAIIEDVLAAWCKMDRGVSKNPALVRKGIVFGIGLAEGLRSGKIRQRRTVKPAAEPRQPQP